MRDGADEIGVPPLVRFSGYALEALAEAREEIDALNVYPVPDGDTGTNLFLTFESGHDALTRGLADQDEREADLLAAVSVYSRGLLLGARGNSGVIMSQLVETLLRHVAVSRSGDRPADVFARGMVAATEAAYAAVGDPVEGTMLTVARSASDAAVEALAADPQASIAQLLGVVTGAARSALARTPEQLAVLRDAGVVDAGGSGLCLVLEAAEAAYTGRRRRVEGRSGPRQSAPTLPTDDLTEDGPAYEVMYLLDADDDRIPELRAALAPLGDSLVVVGGQGLWNVHVHVDDVGAAVEAGIEVGRPHRVRVTHFAEQVLRRRHQALAQEHGRTATGQAGRRVLAVAFGPGLAKVFAEAGAAVVEATVTRRPSTGDLLDAICGAGASEVVLVPNDRDVVPAAEAAARLAENDHGIRVAVIPTSAQVQGMAALAVHEPSRSFEADLVEMAAAARHARSGAVTVAARRAITTAGLCEPGDVLGAVEGDFAVVGDDLQTVALDVLDRMLGGGGELVTVIAGNDGQELARRCAEHVAESHPTVDVLVYDGGQDRYPLLLGVE